MEILVSTSHSKVKVAQNATNQSNGGIWVFSVILIRKKRYLNTIAFQGQMQTLLVCFF